MHDQLSAIDAVRGRRSIRAFTSQPVPKETVELILEIASRAPSGTNMQPWKVHVVAGAARDALSAELVAAHHDPAGAEAGETGAEYRYYPADWFEPYLGRRRKVGWDLYGMLGIAKGDKPAMARQHGRNYDFFGAPVGLFFTMDRKLERGSWLDLGMFMQNVMVVARGVGLDTCPQAAFIKFHGIIRRHLDIPEGEILVSGMALGHADPDAPENKLETDRAPPAEFARFHGF
ncbi:P-nitrobenzoate reductase NfnB [Skermanella stibiiresistens SB22]|uniref:p-nitrobenzoate reductase NfnB n=1 Tax=Skermanella stibiiresistens SB22 TaxID=1385369 RepID=W9H8C1_9PROT|nr:nitroreductase [Skermanella stibiiresistens]EWY41006.1 P-nitrobenzoate reductase NfnB [Skermanella stibiiresistens SB22]